MGPVKGSLTSDDGSTYIITVKLSKELRDDIKSLAEYNDTKNLSATIRSLIKEAIDARKGRTN